MLNSGLPSENLEKVEIIEMRLNESGEVNLGFIAEEEENSGIIPISYTKCSKDLEIQNGIPKSRSNSIFPGGFTDRRQSSCSTFEKTNQHSALRRVSKVIGLGGFFHRSEIQLVGMTEEELLQRLFNAFDYYQDGKLNQDKWIEFLKSRLNQLNLKSQCSQQLFEERKIDFVEIVESIAYAVCGEADLNFESFSIVFKTKDVLNNFFRILDEDLDGIVTVDQVMEFISQLSSARNGSRLTRDNIAYLEKLFRQFVGDGNEISKSDFSKIIQAKNQFFTDRVFDLFDEDGSGSISLQEFLDAMHKFTGENPEDKIQFLFRVYDVDGDGVIQEAELEQVMRACMEENGMKFSDEQIHELTSALFEDADVERRGALTYDALKAQLEKHGGLLENLSISIERWLVPVKPIQVTQKATLFTKLQSLVPHQFSAKYLKNNYVFVLWLIAFIVTNITLFITRAGFFSSKYECATFWLVLAKSSGQALNFNATIILVMMLKQTLTFVRSRGASNFLPIDQHLYFHKLAGYFLVSLGLMHTISHLINIHVGFVRNPTLSIDCGEISHRNWTYGEYLFIPTASLNFGLVHGFAFNTGVFLFIILTIMFVCSLPFVRRGGYFQVFYWTHPLYILFWILLIIHATNFWKWFIVPCIIFVIEQVVRIYRWRLGRGKTYISSGILLPSRVTHLIIRRPHNFHFHPGDYVFVRIPAIAKYEWHPFTISSSPEQEDAIWIHVRAVGEWTNRLYEYFEQEQSKNLDTSIVDLRLKTDTFTKGIKYRRETTRRYSRNPITANPVTRPQLKSVADSVTSCSPESNNSSSVNVSVNDAALMTSSENVLDLDTGSLSTINGKIALTKMSSLPNVNERMTRRERLLNQRQLTRSESAHPSDTSINSSRTSKSPFSSISMIRENSENRSRRYLRYKPTVIKFKTPKDQGDPSERDLCQNLLYGNNSNGKTKENDMMLEEGQGVSTAICYELGTTRMSCEELPARHSLEIFIDGPLGAPSSHIFRAEHAVLIATGIGVTPFASILQSIMRRYWAGRNTCPNCNYTWCSELPESVLNLRKVDFFWINRDQRSFEWFVHLLSQLEIEQAELGGAMERFLDMHMFITSALQKTDMKAVGLQLALDLLHEKEKRDLITGLKTRTNAGRPNWNKIFRQLQDQNKGKVTVFYCGPPSLARTLKIKCDEFGFSFRKEVF